MRLANRLRALPLRLIKVTDPFWSRWHDVLKNTTLDIQYEQLCSTGRLENFRRAARGERGTFEGMRFNDSDVYKWIEAASYLLSALGPDNALEAKLDEVIALIGAAQMPDGYVNTYFQVEHPNERWVNLHMMHEMYCGGHLLEAAAAHFDATGRSTLLEIAVRFVEHVRSVFGPDKRAGYCGHEEFELALFRLAFVLPDRAKADEYSAFARWMIDIRGHHPTPLENEMADDAAVALSDGRFLFRDRKGNYVGEYAQDHAPLREQRRAVGHAVRAMYLYTGATEAFASSGDAKMEEALDAIWTNLTTQRMYVTGGIGPSGSNEGFSEDYDLPNRSAYAETCAACGLVFWARRLAEQTGETEFADVMERALYNGALSGISLDGTTFFYDNPLESMGAHHRQGWFGCACCPPNIARLIASVGRYMVSESDDGFQVQIPASCSVNWEFKGNPVKIDVTSAYPWEGEVTVRVSPKADADFEVALRIPDWCSEAHLELGEGWPEAEYRDGYAVVRRVWKAGDTFKLVLEMEPQWVRTNPAVVDNVGRAALTRGPLVYCLEQTDLGGPVQMFEADTNSDIAVDSEGDLLPGVTALVVDGFLDSTDLDELYQPAADWTVSAKSARMVPYFAWDNRAAGSMLVWLRAR